MAKMKYLGSTRGGDQRFFPLALIAGLLASVFCAMPARGDDDDAKVVATVTTAQIRKGDFSENLTVYGHIVAAPGATVLVSQPIEMRIVHLRVAPGQTVAKQSALAEVEPSLDTRLQWQDAQQKLQAAQKTLADVQQRFNFKLATNADLLQAQDAAKSAQLAVDGLKARGAADGPHTLVALADALVSKVDVQEGQIVPAGSAIVELVPRDKFWARLGIEPSAVGELKINQPVQLFVSDRNEPIAAQIRMIGQLINSDTRLVDIFVEPASADSLLLDSFVRAGITVQHPQSLLVPRSAVLPDEQDSILFTVKDGHAVKHTVKVEQENDAETAIKGEDLKPGDTVVVQGNLELDDGMAVAVELAK